jgi:hypothetical protein
MLLHCHGAVCMKRSDNCDLKSPRFNVHYEDEENTRTFLQTHARTHTHTRCETGIISTTTAHKANISMHLANALSPCHSYDAHTKYWRVDPVRLIIRQHIIHCQLARELTVWQMTHARNARFSRSENKPMRRRDMTAIRRRCIGSCDSDQSNARHYRHSQRSI